MIILCAFALLVISVKLFGGKLGLLATLRLRGMWVLLLALGLQILLINVFEKSFTGATGGALHLVTYALALVFLYWNRRVAGLWLVVLGGLMNLTAIAANGGVMPASAWALKAAGREQASADHFTNSGKVKNAVLLPLGDVIPWPKPLPLSNVFSVGDVALVIGAGVIMHSTTRSRLSRAGRGDHARRRHRHERAPASA